MTSTTLAIIKPDATLRGVEADMIRDIQAAGFTIERQVRRRLERTEAEDLYREHEARTHFADLVDYTVSNEVVLLELSNGRPTVQADFRLLMGPTDRTRAEPHTLRARYAIGLRENSIHGSDSPEAATREIAVLMP